MEFKDKKGRNIFLELIQDTIYAVHLDNDEKHDAGYIQFAVSENPVKYGNSFFVACPEQMHIIKEYQRNGIATKIVKYAKKLYDEVYFAPDTGCGGNTNQIHYSSEGLQFKNFCEKSGITRNILD